MRLSLCLFLVTKIIVITVLVGGLLIGCTTTPPRNIHDACAIFQEYPKWYWEARDAYNQWGVPISVQLAIVRQESHFRAKAKPPRTKLLGIIPWSRPSTAYGYAQALNGTWDHYQQATKNYHTDRDSFGDAVDFIGWYSKQVHKQLGISPRNAYALYLAYHEGITGYSRGSYKKKTWLIQVAKSTAHARQYRQQLLAATNQFHVIQVGGNENNKR